MASTVQWPVCGADGTLAANQVIAERLQSEVQTASGLRVGRQAPPPPRPPGEGIRPAPIFASGQNRPAKRRWFIPALSGTAVALLAVIGVIFGRSYLVKSASARPAVATVAGTADDPKRLDEFNTWYVEPPTGQNAASYFAEGFEVQQNVKLDGNVLPLFGKAKLPPSGSPIPAPMKSAVSQFVNANVDSLRLYNQAAQYDQSRYAVNLAEGYSALFAHLGKIRVATQLLELSALLHSDEHDGKGAANDARVALALARSLQEEPSMMSQVIRANAISGALAILEQSINRTTFPRESLNDLSQLLLKMEDHDVRGEAFSRAMLWERASALSILEQPQKFLAELQSPSPGFKVPPKERVQLIQYLQKSDDLSAEQREYNQAFGRFMELRRSPFPTRLKVADYVREEINSAGQKDLLMTAWLLPGLTGTSAREAACIVRLRLGLVAVALEQFRAAHQDHYPSALAELAPAYLSTVPLDPFDGQPLRFHPKGRGYVLYSVGPDLIDNQGAQINGKETDIVFSVVAAPKLDR